MGTNLKSHPRLTWLALPLVLLLPMITGCDSKSPAKASPPARVENPVTEADLTKITLTPEAVKRLGLTTAAIEYKQVAPTRSYGGELIPPLGKATTLTAPVAGTINLVGEAATQPGGSVRKGQVLFRLSPVDRDPGLEAQRDVEAEQARVGAARQKAARAEQLLRDRAGSARAVEEAQAELAIADAQLKAARARLRDFGGSGENGGLSIAAPQDAVLQKLYVSPGQAVSAGAALADIASVDALWIRVPIYVGDLPAIDRKKSALVILSGNSGQEVARTALPVHAPPIADPRAATADLYYQLPNPGRTLRPGQSVTARIALSRTQEHALVAPWSAILHDVHGGTWIYENPSAHVFTRRRVEVRYVADGLAVLERGPTPGTKVVIAGAAELFGTEFGAGK